jgi:ABC-type transport system involved in multi-copper enzyme maturation permease subunit
VSFINSYASELFKVRRRPALWVILSVWLALMLLFTYVFPYVGYRDATNAREATGLLTRLLPASLAGQALTGYPVWGGSLIVVLGALVAGSEYGWGTLKALLSNSPGRLTVYLGQIAALFTILAALVIVAFGCSGLASIIIGATTHAQLVAPSASDLAKSMAAGWMILCMWCTFGVALATLFRGTALSIGLGVVWVLAVENLLRATAAIVPVIATVEKGLPGVNAGALVAALGGPASTAGGTGIAAIVGGAQALAVVAVYLVLFAATAGLLLKRRDVQ